MLHLTLWSDKYEKKKKEDMGDGHRDANI
jgi:hypothetical protein